MRLTRLTDLPAEFVTPCLAVAIQCPSHGKAAALPAGPAMDAISPLTKCHSPCQAERALAAHRRLSAAVLTARRASVLFAAHDPVRPLMDAVLDLANSTGEPGARCCCVPMQCAPLILWACRRGPLRTRLTHITCLPCAQALALRQPQVCMCQMRASWMCLTGTTWPGCAPRCASVRHACDVAVATCAGLRLLWPPAAGRMRFAACFALLACCCTAAPCLPVAMLCHQSNSSYQQLGQHAPGTSHCVLAGQDCAAGLGA